MFLGMKTFLLSVSALVLLSGCLSSKEPEISSPPQDEGQTGVCPVTTTGPTVHQGDIETDEVWTAVGSPHIVEGDVNVVRGAKLTIEPCAVVKLASDVTINVAFPGTPGQGELIAEGTATQPIRFERAGEEPWGRIHVAHPGKARLAHATLTDGGGSSTSHGESLAFMGDSDLPGKRGLRVDHVTVTRSRGLGVLVQGGGGFHSDSKALTLTANGGNSNPYPLLVGELGVDSIPEGAYVGNARDEILIVPETVAHAGGFQEHATIRDRGVPYRFGIASDRDHFRITSGGAGTTAPIVTIEPGVTLKMVRGAVIELDGANGQPAVIQAVGTAEKPIVFTSAESTPNPGDWRGFYFNGRVSADNRLEHVRIDYTGSDCSCSLLSCSPEATEYEAALIFGDQPPTMFLKNSTIAHASGHAIVQGYEGASLDWKTGNTFEEVTGCVATIPWPKGGAECPNPAPSCR